jgi:hypothetical protein
MRILLQKRPSLLTDSRKFRAEALPTIKPLWKPWIAVVTSPYHSLTLTRVLSAIARLQYPHNHLDSARCQFHGGMSYEKGDSVCGCSPLSILDVGCLGSRTRPVHRGGVARVTLIQILPGHFNAFMDDLKTNIKPIWDAEKKAALIENYSIFLNSTKANPDDWDIGVAISYKNFAALDGLAQKVLDLRMKQYGDKSKEQQVIDKRVQNARTVASFLTRDITLK